MSKIFSLEFLKKMRNDIPINFIIARILKIPCKSSEGIFRFLCPKCSSFNTATNKKTNLARCFKCKENYNPIDIVMINKNASFLETAKFLKIILAQFNRFKKFGTFRIK